MDRRSFLAGAGGLAAAGFLPALQRRPRAGSRADWVPENRLLADLPVLMEVAAVPGTVIAVVEDGELEWQAAVGVRDVATGEAMTGDTQFELASLGKPVFAYLVMRLREAGLLDLDRPLGDYLATEEMRNPFSARVTARHVLAHTAGLPNWRDAPVPLELSGEPGRRFAYSGEGYFHLQRVVEALTGLPFERCIQSMVLQPLGMAASTYVWTPAVEAALAQGHVGLTRPQPSENYTVLGRLLHGIAETWGKPLADWRYDDMVRAVPLADPAWDVLPTHMVPNAAGSLFGTAADYARFMSTMMEESDVAVLDEGSRREMLSPQVQVNSAMWWGLGWGIERERGREYFWHWGNNDVYRCFAIGDARARRAVVVLTNSSNGHKLYRRIVTETTQREHAVLLWFRT